MIKIKIKIDSRIGEFAGNERNGWFLKLKLHVAARGTAASRQPAMQQVAMKLESYAAVDIIVKC